MFTSVYSCASSASYRNVLSLDALNEQESDLGFQFIHANCRVDDPPTDLATAELSSAVREFVAGLPGNLSEIAIRHYWLNQSQVEIATDLGLSRSAICHALARVHKLGRKVFALH